MDVCQDNDTVGEILLIPILYEDAPIVQEERTAKSAKYAKN
ncbi:hypothetical protein [Nostoc sp.]